MTSEDLLFNIGCFVLSAIFWAVILFIDRYAYSTTKVYRIYEWVSIIDDKLSLPKYLYVVILLTIFIPILNFTTVGIIAILYDRYLTVYKAVIQWPSWITKSRIYKFFNKNGR